MEIFRWLLIAIYTPICIYLYQVSFKLYLSVSHVCLKPLLNKVEYEENNSLLLLFCDSFLWQAVRKIVFYGTGIFWALALVLISMYTAKHHKNAVFLLASAVAAILLVVRAHQLNNNFTYYIMATTVVGIAYFYRSKTAPTSKLIENRQLWNQYLVTKKIVSSVVLLISLYFLVYGIWYLHKWLTCNPRLTVNCEVTGPIGTLAYLPAGIALLIAGLFQFSAKTYKIQALSIIAVFWFGGWYIFWGV